MRKIDYIVIHATGSTLDATVQDIQKFWKDVRKWKNPGYHKLIDKYGTIHELAKPHRIVNGAKGYNHNGYHIAWIGGMNSDNRTPEQKESLKNTLIWAIDTLGKNLDIVGHRDLSPDLNSDGFISPDEWYKRCPSFDVVSWLNETGIYNYLLS